VYTFTDDIAGQQIWVQRSDVTLDGMGHQLKNNTYNFDSGITLNSTKNVTVKNFQISGFYFGVKVQLQLWDSTVGLYEPQPKPDLNWIPKNNNIVNCAITCCKGAGVRVYDSSSTLISKNIITDSTVGVELSLNWGEAVSANQVTNNTLQNNGEGILLQSCGANTISGNIVTENRITGIDLSWSSSNSVSGNIITKNGVGVLVMGAAGSGAGYTSNNVISNNLIAQNIRWGLRLNATQINNQIFGNSIIDNNPGTQGLQVSIPMCMIVENIKGKVTINMVSGMGNVWNSGGSGNYWSDFKDRYHNATEVDTTGVWNIPFYINENNIDHYPLVEPLSNSALPIQQQTTTPQQITNPITPNALSTSNIILVTIAVVLTAVIMGSLLYFKRLHRKK